MSETTSIRPTFGAIWNPLTLVEEGKEVPGYSDIVTKYQIHSESE